MRVKVNRKTITGIELKMWLRSHVPDFEKKLQKAIEDTIEEILFQKKIEKVIDKNRS